mgnify:CR=1 FL=1
MAMWEEEYIEHTMFAWLPFYGLAVCSAVLYPLVAIVVRLPTSVLDTLINALEWVSQRYNAFFEAIARYERKLERKHNWTP